MDPFCHLSYVTEYKLEIFQSQNSCLLWEQCSYIQLFKTSYINQGRSSPSVMKKDLVGCFNGPTPLLVSLLPPVFLKLFRHFDNWVNLCFKSLIWQFNALCLLSRTVYAISSPDSLNVNFLSFGPLSLIELVFLGSNYTYQVFKMPLSLTVTGWVAQSHILSACKNSTFPPIRTSFISFLWAPLLNKSSRFQEILPRNN